MTIKMWQNEQFHTEKRENMIIGVSYISIGI